MVFRHLHYARFIKLLAILLYIAREAARKHIVETDDEAERREAFYDHLQIELLRHGASENYTGDHRCEHLHEAQHQVDVARIQGFLVVLLTL